MDEELDVQDSLSKLESFFLFFLSFVTTQKKRSDFFLTDIFKFDAKYLENEERYKSIKAELWVKIPMMSRDPVRMTRIQKTRKVSNMFFIVLFP